jgi:hypothetical protein
MTVHVLGIRHHGPGSARSVERALNALQPDCVLIEGPPELTEIAAFAGHAEMIPPIAGFVFATDRPELSVFDPFASFSPEWIALRYALSRALPVRFIDLAATHELAKRAAAMSQREAALLPPVVVPETELANRSDGLDEVIDPQRAEDSETPGPTPGSATQGDQQRNHPTETLDPESANNENVESDVGSSGLPVNSSNGESGPSLGTRARLDPIGTLAELAGVGDAERWWEDVVEHQIRTPTNDAEVEAESVKDRIARALRPFVVIGEAMRDLRAAADSESDGASFLDIEREAQREASMRQGIRQAEKDGFSSIAVVCGAWHAPVLERDTFPSAASDAAVLKGLPKIKSPSPGFHGPIVCWPGQVDTVLEFRPPVGMTTCFASVIRAPMN